MQDLVCKFETLMNRDRVGKSKQSSILDYLKEYKNSSFSNFFGHFFLFIPFIRVCIFVYLYDLRNQFLKKLEISSSRYLEPFARYPESSR